MQVPLGKHFYELKSKPLSAQRAVNLYFEPATEGAKTDGALYSTPGLTTFASVGDGPIYGMRAMGGLLYAVSGNNVYTIDQFGGATNLGSMGTVSDVTIMSDDGTYVIIVLESGAAYLATSSSLVQITDGDFPSVSSVTVLDTYAIFTKLNTTQYVISAVGDPTAYDALDIASAESSPDLLVRAFAFNDELWLFGEVSTEIHYNSASGDFPFIARQNSTIQRGCAAKRSVAQEDNTIFWLGEDRTVYRANGYTPQRISTHAIEQRLQGYTTIEDAEAFVYTQDGHKFYCLTFPTELETWVYDIATGLWHQRQSFDEGRWRATSHAFVYDKNLVGDFETGDIYELSLSVYTDNGTPIERITTLPINFDNDKRVMFASLKIDFDSGVGALSGQGSEPLAIMRYSDDGGRTWSSERYKKMGALGVYETQAVWRRLGMARQRVFEIKVTDPVEVNITGAYINESD